jgi:flagella basal body P-ring formation protein FlgA
MTIFALLLLVACHGVEGDSILGRHLAAADAQFAAVPEDARIGYAPMPGTQRTLSAMDLTRVAARFGIEGEFHDLCFEYPTRRLETGEMLSAMRESLKVASARIEIAEFSLYAAPKGVVVFPLTGLSRPSPARAEEPVIWRGYVEYGSSGTAQRKFAVWAKVRLQVEETRVVAAENLAVAQAVQGSQLRVEQLHGFPTFQVVASTVDQVVGHTLRRPVRKDAAVPLDAIENGAVREVNRGEAVEVEVDAGLAHLKFDGRAESGGALGEVVTVRNAKSGKIFAARVVGKGKVEVVAGTSE